MAVLIFLGLAFVALAVLPGLWVKKVLRDHSHDRPDFPGTGGELAQHLLERLNIKGVGVEETPDLGDHYDPQTKMVRLSPAHYSGRSLAAVAVAAHEVGHAMQDATGYKPLKARTRLAGVAMRIQQVGSIVMLAAPVMMIIVRHPAGLLLELIAGLAIMASAVVIHLITLPVEYDASFNRALPVLKEGGYLKEGDLKPANKILKAAALTYVAAAAMSLLDIARWIRILLR